MKDLITRRAKLTDLKGIQDLNHELFLQDSKFDKTLNVNWPYEEGRNYFVDAITKDYALCLVVEHKKKIVGYLAAFTIKPETWRTVRRAEIENMFIKKNYRGKGIGTIMVKEYLKWCKKKGMQKGLVITFTKNSHAIEFYKKLGFYHRATALEIDIR